MGGTSSEKAVSLDTGKAVAAALERLNHQVTPLEWNETDLLQNNARLKEFDIIFIGYHGTLGEDGHVQSILELLGIPYTGSSSLSSALGMDKFASRKVFSSCGIPVAPGIPLFNAKTLRTEDIHEHILNSFEYPAVVKPRAEGSTIGISIVNDLEELKAGIEEAVKYGSDVLIEKFIPGRELTVAILGEEILPVIEVIASHDIYDYVCKYTKGKTRYICPADIEKTVEMRVKELAQKAFTTIGCESYGRVDFRFDGKECYCLEANTLPGMTELSLVPMAAKVNGTSFDQLINNILNYGYQERKK